MSLQPARTLLPGAGSVPPQPGPSDHARAVRAHAGYFAQLAGELRAQLHGAGVPDAGAAQLGALRGLRMDLENMEAALQTLLVWGDWEPLAAIAAALDEFWTIIGDFKQCVTIARLLERAVAASGHEQFKLLALSALANSSHNSGDYRTARQAAEQALRLSRELGQSHFEAAALALLGRIEDHQGSLPLAQALLQEALAVYRRLNDRWGVAKVLNCLGNLAGDRADYAEAGRLHGEALEIRRAIDDLHGEAGTINNLGNVKGEEPQGNLQQAVALYEKALAINRRLGSLHWEATNLNNLGRLKGELGDFSGAWTLLERALAISREAGDRYGEIHSYFAMAVVKFRQGRPQEILPLAEQGLALSSELGWKHGILQACGAASGLVKPPSQIASICFGTEAQLRLSGLTIHAIVRETLDAVQSSLQSAVTAGQISADDLARWQAEGEAMTLDELAQFTLAALCEAQQLLGEATAEAAT